MVDLVHPASTFETSGGESSLPLAARHFFVVDELDLVHAPGRQTVNPSAVPLAGNNGAFSDVPVRETEDPVAVSLVVHERAFVDSPVGEAEDPAPIPLAVYIGTFSGGRSCCSGINTTRRRPCVEQDEMPMPGKSRTTDASARSSGSITPEGDPARD